MTTIRVVKVPARGEGLGEIVYVGRKNIRERLDGSPLANPYVIGRDGDRATVIKKYEEWLDGELKKIDSPPLTELARLVKLARQRDNLSLMCWCAPQACHGDIIRNKLWAAILTELPVGTRIKFIRECEERANEDHPDLIYANKGDEGEVVSHGTCWEGHMVKVDWWPNAFGAQLYVDFIPL